uniref:hypothetical protein n=1 Tax=Bradyrhizobium sp. URHD0069 TaxID=1380355 RepID=UPI001AEC1853
SSMKGRERPCSIRRRLRSSQNVLQRSVELAAHALVRDIPVDLKEGRLWIRLDLDQVAGLY